MTTKRNIHLISIVTTAAATAMNANVIVTPPTTTGIATAAIAHTATTATLPSQSFGNSTSATTTDTAADSIVILMKTILQNCNVSGVTTSQRTFWEAPVSHTSNLLISIVPNLYRRWIANSVEDFILRHKSTLSHLKLRDCIIGAITTNRATFGPTSGISNRYAFFSHRREWDSGFLKFHGGENLDWEKDGSPIRQDKEALDRFLSVVKTRRHERLTPEQILELEADLKFALKEPPVDHSLVIELLESIGRGQDENMIETFLAVLNL
ncbi:hypothetical protein C8J56DRAFT_1047840 [Mycena floridula]|nr:hypothetical protein C8J56DRAFT_1047840 [Mycena floridula]